MSCHSVMFLTVKRQFSIKSLAAAFSKLQVDPIQHFSPKSFSFSTNFNKSFFTFLKKQNLLVEKVHQEACFVVILRIFYFISCENDRITIF